MDLKTLLELRIQAKQEEDAAIAKRRKIDEDIVDAMPGDAEGSVSLKLDDMKITVTRKVTRKVNTVELQKDWEFVPENVQKAFDWEAKLVMKQFRALQQLATDELKTVSKYITTTPASPSVSIEPV